MQGRAPTQRSTGPGDARSAPQADTRTRRRRVGSGEADVLTAYLNQIGRFPLLSAAEEVALAQAMEAGRSASAALERGVVDRAERAGLEEAVRTGRDARARFLNSNLRLVVALAGRYRGVEGMDLLDVIQEGNVGLMRAVDKFDWRRGFKFSTYATWWIRQAMSRGVAEKARAIRIPAGLHDRAPLVHGIAIRLRAELGRAPTAEEVADEAGIERDVVEEVLSVQNAVSLESPVGEDGAVLGDFIAGHGDDDPESLAETGSVAEDVRAALERLGERERRILALRYGFVDGVPRPHDEIAAEFGLTRERIRQIERAALARLRHPAGGMLEQDVV